MPRMIFYDIFMTLFTTKNCKISHIKNDREDNPSLFWLLYKKFRLKENV
ncbi:Uncharacterized protein NEOC95_000605 [Neochlamydia sp. AcF95]|nr:Uncharacterized protein [Neochlamydia sp. AcF95]